MSVDESVIPWLMADTKALQERFKKCWEDSGKTEMDLEQCVAFLQGVIFLLEKRKTPIADTQQHT
jgi:hypothetical protein